MRDESNLSDVPRGTITDPDSFSKDERAARAERAMEVLLGDGGSARADDMFERVVQCAESAAALDVAAGYTTAINGFRWAASVLNPSKYGTKVVGPSGAVEGYIVETGIRREGDAGFAGEGSLPGQGVRAPGVPDGNGELAGQNDHEHVDQFE